MARSARLDQLQGRCSGAVPDSELDFLLACTYRLLQRRSPSVGDVVALTTSDSTAWLACEPGGWRRITRPENRTGPSLTATTVYEHLRPSDDE